jgi:ubiquinone/menaquinone biosynthesis C-methylase UbiE
MATSTTQETTPGEPLPAYASQLDAFHQGFRRELSAMIDSLPLRPGMRVLDVACGSGFYTRLLADRVGPGGMAVGIDSSHEYLQRTPNGRQVYLCGGLEALPLRPATFDVLLCAQNLYSLPEPVQALERMKSAIRPGGAIAVLEGDTIHEIILPWPARLELAVRSAEHRALCDETKRPARFYVGRELLAVLAEAGFEPSSLRSQVIDRATPLGDAETFFVHAYLQRLGQRVQPYLDATTYDELRTLIDEQSPEYLLRRPHVTISWMNLIAIARGPS